MVCGSKLLVIKRLDENHESDFNTNFNKLCVPVAVVGRTAISKARIFLFINCSYNYNKLSIANYTRTIRTQSKSRPSKLCSLKNLSALLMNVYLSSGDETSFENLCVTMCYNESVINLVHEYLFDPSFQPPTAINVLSCLLYAFSATNFL